jgi:hypothetical protein
LAQIYLFVVLDNYFNFSVLQFTCLQGRDIYDI